jgi:hypothetical protein
MAVARAGLTFVTLLVGLPLVALLLFSLSGDGEAGLLVGIGISATAFPLVALAFAAPTFRIKQYILNGGFTALTFPRIPYLLFDADGIEDPGPQSVFAVILVTGPALLILGGSTLVWTAIRRMRSPRGAAERRSS